MNPNQFLLWHPEMPFNFNMNTADWDAFFHNPRMPDSLKSDDPCNWPEETRQRVDAQCAERIALFEECSRGLHNHG